MEKGLYGIKTYRRMVKALKTSHVAPNKLERKFKDGNPN